MNFQYCEWNQPPKSVEQIKGNRVIVTRSVTEAERDGEKVYIGESAIMSETAYAAYVGAKEVAAKREQEIVDETILNLIEEGSL